MISNQSLLQVDSLTKSYSGKAAVTNLSFNLNSGSILGLVGPNGAGKTTTLRMLAGIIKPTSGHVKLNGINTVKQPLVTKRVTGYVPDEPHLFESLTVWEHLEFTASIYDLNNYTEHAVELLRRFHLTSERNSSVHQLSLGMRQKVAICCMYLTRPKLLLFDEPLTGLDPMGIREISASISSFANSGSSVIISSHLLGLVENLCTDVLLLSEGSCLLSGPLDDVLNRIYTAPGRPAESLESVFFRTLNKDE